MLRSVKAGKSINEEDIPPAVLLHSSRSNSRSDLSQSDANSSAVNTEMVPPVMQESLHSPQRPSSIQQNIIFKGTNDMSPMASEVSNNFNFIVKIELMAVFYLLCLNLVCFE